MEIREFRLVLRAKDFDRTCRFYEEVLGLPRLADWDHATLRGARFQAGGGALEIIGRPRERPGDRSRRGRDEAFDYQGPQHKLVLNLVVPSAQKAYEELIFRDKNIPGGLRQSSDGVAIFETHDPDGVKIELREAE
jgi:catechol 2,3-dioxygenase-like lactoylglutathione lyase family enzyme